MKNDNCQKIKLLKLMELLRQETDEKHPITTSEICRRLGEMGISCERRTVGKDMRVLREQGFEIMSELKGHENSYWVSDRSFELPELKILMDAVQAALFSRRIKPSSWWKRLPHSAERIRRSCCKAISSGSIPESIQIALFFISFRLSKTLCRRKRSFLSVISI